MGETPRADICSPQTMERGLRAVGNAPVFRDGSALLSWYLPRMSAPNATSDSPLLRHGRALAVVLVLFALALRVPDLFGWWPNPDEGIYYGVVTRESWSAAMAEAWATAHPPLYFLLLRAVGALSTDFTALRIVALLSGCAAVWVFVLLGREIGGPGVRGEATGLLTGVMLAVSPRAIALSQVMRPYMLLVLALAASLLFLLRYLRAPSLRLLVAHLGCSLVAALLHYSSLFALGVIGLVALWETVRRGLGRPERRRLLAAQAIPAALLATLYLVHLRAIASGELGDHALDGWLASYMIVHPVDAWLGLVGLHSMMVGNAWAAPAALFTLGSVGWAVYRRAWSPIVLMSVGGLAVGVLGAAAQVYPFGPTRHTAWLLVFVVPTAAWALASVLTAPRGVAVRALPTVVLALVAARLAAPVLDPERRPREISEHVLREDAVAAMASVLDPNAPPPLVLMSHETYELLTPLYAVERRSAETSTDGQFLRFRWGSRDVVVLPSRDFATRPDEVLQPNHLYTGARMAAAELGVELPVADEPVLVLSGGWRSQGMADLVDLARSSGPLGTTTSVPGLVGLYLDFDAFRRALGQPAP
jgi:hypothetical protein